MEPISHIKYYHRENKLGTCQDAWILSGFRPDGSQMVFGTAGLPLSYPQLKHLKKEFSELIIASDNGEFRALFSRWKISDLETPLDKTKPSLGAHQPELEWMT